MTSQITLVGNLTGDPELRFTPSGKAVANLTIAVNERIKNQATGEWEDGEGSFYNCAVWGDAAENVAESLTKGMRVIVSGGLKMRSYERREGGKGLSADVTVDEIGPALRWATAKVTRAARSGGNNGGNGGGYQQQAPQASSAPAADPWGTPAAVGAGAPAADPWGNSSNDEPPF